MKIYKFAFNFHFMSSLAPFVPTPPDVIYRMLKLANVGPNDVVYDLGCGDGRILIAAVEGFKAKMAVGIEIRDDLAKKAITEVSSRGLEGRVKIINNDIFNVDISDATVVTLYLTYSGNARLKPKLERELRNGVRVVSYTFEVPGWTPRKIDKYSGWQTIYLYQL